MIIVDKNPINNSRKALMQELQPFMVSLFSEKIFLSLDSNNKMNYEGLKNFLLTNLRKLNFWFYKFYLRIFGFKI